MEFRPYIKDIAGRRRMFFLGTVSAIRDDAKKFDGSATPDLALIDSEYRDVIWIDVKHPSQWDKMVYEQLNEAWRASEKIGYYFDEVDSNVPVIQEPVDSIRGFPKEEFLKQVQDKKKAEDIEMLQHRLDSLKALKN